MRTSGILLPIFSLPNSYGIGTLGKEAYDFVDFLEKCHQTYWQVLPIGPTSYGDSPYQSFSVFAGNPYFIDFDLLKEEGLLEESDYEEYLDESLSIDYGKIYNTRYLVLRRAYSKFDIKLLKNFEKENSDWLEDFSLFMTLKDYHHGVSFLEWEDDYKFRNKKAIASFKKEHLDDVNFWKFTQYYFFKQWNDLRVYANSKGIKIIGDMPIYTALDSSDVWSNPNLFQLGTDLKPKLVAGCPADDFAPLGQLWGNPLYDYKAMKETNYAWWVRRVEVSIKLFDTIRIDHFRGFEAYFAIPASDSDALRGKWKKGPNVGLFNAIKNALGEVDIIAENLGFLTEGVHKMLKRLGYPGMKILEFEVYSYEASRKLANGDPNNVLYPGTHDNNTFIGWYNENASWEDKNNLHRELNHKDGDKLINNLIKYCYSSNYNYVVF